MEVILTRGTGLVGSALAAGLVKDGHRVIVLSRNPSGQTGKMPEGVQVVEWDARTSEGWLKYAEAADAIVNLAGEDIASRRWTEKRKQSLLESRANAGAAVVEAVEKAARKPGLVIQASEIGYYGPRKDKQVIEKSPAGKGFLADVVAAWEAATAPVEALGVRRVIARSGVVLNKQGGSLSRMAMPFRFYIGGPIASGRQWFSWIHLDDEVRALRFLLENEKASGPYNLTAPNPVTNRKFAQTVGKVMKRPAIIPAPASLLRLVYGERSCLWLEGQRAAPKKLQDAKFAFRFPDIESALREIYV